MGYINKANAPTHVPRFGYCRGGVVQRYERYSHLVANVEQLCSDLGIPKSRWTDIFDWNR